MPEVRVTSETGGEKGQKEERFGGADPLALVQLARVYGMGEAKYARFNYLKGYPWSLSIDALFRHLFAFLGGEDRDPESGHHHMAHVAWHALTLVSFSLRRVGTDDRAPRPPVEDTLLPGWQYGTVSGTAAPTGEPLYEPNKVYATVRGVLPHGRTTTGECPTCGAGPGEQHVFDWGDTATYGTVNLVPK